MSNAALLDVLRTLPLPCGRDAADLIEHQAREIERLCSDVEIAKNKRLAAENLALQECEWKKRAEAAERELAEAQAQAAALREALRIVNGRIQQARAGRLMTAAEVTYDDETHRIIGDALAASPSALSARREAEQRVIEAAREFEADLSPDCDGPKRDALRQALAASSATLSARREAEQRVIEAARTLLDEANPDNGFDRPPSLHACEVLNEALAALEEKI